ncbi:MAG: o-succinylbenzoate--CoA ligase [Candidatus Zixiibacteriota bacterium]
MQTRSIKCPLRLAAEKWGDHPALIVDDDLINWRSYDMLVSQVAGRLLSLGIKRGDRVAILLENRVEYPPLLMALFRLGAVACPLNIYLPESGVALALSTVGSRFIIADSEGARHHGYGAAQTIALQRLYELDERVTVPATEIDLDQPATIIFTSGSSGRPKAALHTYGNHYYSALGSNENIPFGPGDSWILSLPLYHVGGLAILFRAQVGGGAVMIGIPDSAQGVMMRSRSFTHVSLVSTLLYRWLGSGQTPKQMAAGVKAVLMGGSAIPDSLLQQADSAGLPIFKSYGLTEMASQVTTTAVGDLPAKIKTSGKPLRYRQVSIASDGEILVKGETLFAGYVNGESIERPVDDDGWFHTGDLGQIDADGYLTVTGRKDNMFISGGENIQPEEIEAALMQVAGVEGAVVVPVADDEWGQRPVAFVMSSGGIKMDIDSLGDRLQSALPVYKIPTAFLFHPMEAQQGQLKVSRARFAEMARKKLGGKE